MRFRTVVGEAIRSLGATKSTTVAATLTVLIGMFVLGLTISLGTWVLSWSDHVKKELLVKVYFKAHASDKQTDTVRFLLKKDERIKSFEFISKEKALAQMRRKYPDLTKSLSYNPLPDAFEITPKHASDVAAIKHDLNHFTTNAHGQPAPPPGVDKVKDGGEKAKKILRFGSIVEIVFLIGLIVLLAASTLLIANTIRLSIFARRREIEVMKLVGATNWFVRGPFMIEGLLTGLLGSAFAVLLLLLSKQVVLPALNIQSLDNNPDVRALAFELTAGAIIVAGLLLGATGSGLTIRRFLRV